ncbi:MAG: hypothetical protein K2X27_16920 [Candidatus Obscuribacterales bacterium]|nr:hypothetical protein [Candidatus Obscuribacterales bacterium]
MLKLIRSGPRNDHGSITALAVSLLLFVITMGLGLFQICRLLSGNSEFKDAVNAGALNATKAAMQDPSVDRIPGDEYEILTGAIESDKGLTLKNFNRVAGVEFLVELNESAMESEGSSTARSKDHAKQLDKTVGNLAQLFSSNLLGIARRIGHFDSVAADGDNYLRMFGSRVIGDLGDLGWDKSYVNPGTASNVYMNDNQIPYGLRDKLKVKDCQQLPTTPITINGNKNYYVCGYMQIDSLVDHSVRPPRRSYFFPLRPPLKPHLISEQEFDLHREAPALIDESYAIPNAFRASGKTRIPLADQSMSFTACGLAEATDPGYGMSIPTGFLRVENLSDKAVNLTELVDSAPKIQKLIEQRFYEIDPDFDTSTLDKILDAVGAGHRGYLAGQKKALITPGDAQRVSVRARTSDPDGNSTMSPVITNGYKLQWIPCTGYTGLLGVIQISEDSSGSSGTGRPSLSSN